MSLVKSIAGNEICDQTARNNFSNLSIGGKNLLLGTGIAHTMTGSNKTNQCGGDYSLPSGGISKLEPGTYTCSVDIVGTVEGGSFGVQWNGTPWGIANAIVLKKTKQRVITTFTLNDTSSYTAWGIQIRLDNVSGTVTISNMKLEKGNKPTDWTPALEDSLTLKDDGSGNVTISIL